jgi:hypothetical protein
MLVWPCIIVPPRSPPHSLEQISPCSKHPVRKADKYSEDDEGGPGGDSTQLESLPPSVYPAPPVDFVSDSKVDGLHSTPAAPPPASARGSMDAGYGSKEAGYGNAGLGYGALGPQYASADLPLDVAEIVSGSYEAPPPHYEEPVSMPAEYEYDDRNGPGYRDSTMSADVDHL